MMLRSRHLLGIADLEPDEVSLILDTAEAMTEIAARPIKKVPALRGRTVVNLFFEPSTRTRMSFEVAEKRLSADTLSIAVATSSVTKGETLLDTVRNLFINVALFVIVGALVGIGAGLALRPADGGPEVPPSTDEPVSSSNSRRAVASVSAPSSSSPLGIDHAPASLRSQ